MNLELRCLLIVIFATYKTKPNVHPHSQMLAICNAPKSSPEVLQTMNHFPKIMCVILSFVVFVGPVSSAEFRSGCAMRIITPDPLLPVSGGVGEPNAATQKCGELTARAIVFSNGETTIAVVGIDALGFSGVLNYAIHPEVPGSESGFSSPDCIGPMCDQIKERFGGIAVVMNSAQGGMVTAVNHDFSKPTDELKGVTPDSRSWGECLRIGQLMASEAERIVSHGPVQRSPVVSNLTRHVEFPVESAMMRAIVAGSPLKYPHTDDFKIKVQVNLVTLGNTQILTIPGEALPKIGFYLKRKMKGQNNFLFGLTNDAFGYILTKVDFESFDRYACVSRTGPGEMTGEILIENALEMINE
jgi:hypothetical protein